MIKFKLFVIFVWAQRMLEIQCLQAFAWGAKWLRVYNPFFVVHATNKLNLYITDYNTWETVMNLTAQCNC